MRRLFGSTAIAGVALALAACGSGGHNASNATHPASASGTVSVATVGGVAGVLVDASGKALYTPDQEANGMILCTGACTSFWKPLAPSASTLTTASTGLTFGVITRPDGSQQTTADAKPLYTFAEDSSGQLKGNNFSDDFGSEHFTWHVVQASGAAAAPSAPASTSAGSGYGY